LTWNIAMNSKRIAANWIVSGIMAGVCFLATPVRAQLVTNTYNFTVNEAIPDNDLAGVSDTQTITPGILSITELIVTLSISGGFNGDYYAYLTHDTGFAVLLNRAGRTATEDFGYPDSGRTSFRRISCAPIPGGPGTVLRSPIETPRCASRTSLRVRSTAARNDTSPPPATTLHGSWT
jgi:hypothetical protein